MVALLGLRLGEARRPGPKPKKKSRPSTVDVVVLNTTGLPQLKSAMDYYRLEGGRHRAQLVAGRKKPPTVGAIVAQEHHATGTAWADLQAQAFRAGWSMAGVAAVRDGPRAARGTSGVCVAAAKHLGLSDGGNASCSPEGSLGRAAGAWVDSVVRGGIYIVSIYLWDGEGMTARNLSIVQSAAEAVLRHGGPWMIAGDWNMLPTELDEASDIIHSIGGMIVAPDAPTCKSASGGRTIDFAVVDQRLHGAVERVWTDTNFTSSPHTAVVYRFRCTATRALVQTFRRPRTFPTELVIGCQPPPKPDADSVHLAVQQQFLHNKDDPVVLDTVFCKVITAAEHELCNLFGKVDGSGVPDPKHVGRGKETEVVWRPSFPRTASDLGKVDAVGLGLDWAQIRVRQLVCLLCAQRRLPQGERLRPDLCRHWRDLSRKFAKPTGVFATMIAADSVWYGRAYALGQLCYTDTHCYPALLR